MLRMDEKEIQIQAGDLFTIYSDGITEAMNDKMEEYGDKALIEKLKQNSSLSVKVIQEKILQDVSLFSGSTPQHDDITLLLLKVSA